MRTFIGKILNGNYRVGTELKDMEITDEPLVVLSYGKIIQENEPQEQVERPVGRKDYQFFYIKHGEFNFINRKTNTVYGKNTLFLFKPGEPQFRYPLCENQRCTHLFVHFSGNFVEELLNRYNINKSVINFESDFDAFEDIINRMEAGKSGKFHENFCNILLEELFILISNNAKHSSTKEEGFKELLRIMDETCTKNYPIKYYADMIHFSEVYFVRFFKKAMGNSPHKYLIMKRMQKATSMLTYTSDSIKMIAEKLGFSNQHYFSKVFFDFYKIPPSEYRSLKKEEK